MITKADIKQETNSVSYNRGKKIYEEQDMMTNVIRYISVWTMKVWWPTIYDSLESLNEY